MQVKYNIPLLTLGAFYILSECHRHDRDNVLFSSRDCYFLKRIFDSINGEGHEIKSLYFYTSRVARLSKSDDYAKYVRSCLSGRPLIVDLCGTGWSLSAMLDHIGVSAPFCLLHDISDNDLVKNYSGIRKISESHERSFLIKESQIGNSFIEKMNFVNHGMIEDVKHITDFNQFVPVQKPNNYPSEISMYVSTTQSIIARFTKILNSYDLSKMFIETHNLGAQFPEVFKAIYSHADADLKFTPSFIKFHEEEDQDVMMKLSNYREE